MDIHKIIFHIDVNSAYLSWEAVSRLQHGYDTDLRNIPSAVGGNPKERHGIILAKSIPAKKYNIKTGDSLFAAFNKCPNLLVVPPNYDLYVKCSNALINILKGYSPLIQRYSIDECFIDFSNSKKNCPKPLEVAYKMKKQIKKELGFTVNIGISTNKLLAKMASEFEKPDRIHTLFPEEIQTKMWPLPVRKLFMVGRKTSSKLFDKGIYTIGDLAKSDLDLIRYYFKKYGIMIWNYANGLEHSPVMPNSDIPVKGMGNSTTISFDVYDKKTAHMVMLSLVETTAARLRQSGMLCSVVSINLKNNSFFSYSHQKKLSYPTDSTYSIYKTCKSLFNEVWSGEPLRLIGVRVGNLCTKEFSQISFFDKEEYLKQNSIDKIIDDIRMKYGKNIITRSCFLYSGLKAVAGGVSEDEYPMMSSIL